MPGRERVLINPAGRVVVDPLCPPIALLLQIDRGEVVGEEDRLLVRKNIIPGLDANLCRCIKCKDQEPLGIYWIDERMRVQIYEDKVARRKQAAKL